MTRVRWTAGRLAPVPGWPGRPVDGAQAAAASASSPRTVRESGCVLMTASFKRMTVSLSHIPGFDAVRGAAEGHSRQGGDDPLPREVRVRIVIEPDGTDIFCDQAPGLR